MKSSAGAIKLNPTAVRERAKSVPGCKEVLADGPTVLSFIVGMRNNSSLSSSSNKKNRRQQQEQPRAKDLARVNIWTDSGTVGTSRVIDGKVRQSFRRNVQRYVCMYSLIIPLAGLIGVFFLFQLLPSRVIRQSLAQRSWVLIFLLLCFRSVDAKVWMLLRVY